MEELEKAAVMADDYALTHKLSSNSGNPKQQRFNGSSNVENISRNMDDIKRQDKSTENVALVSKVEPLKPILLWATWKTWPFNYKLLEVRW